MDDGLDVLVQEEAADATLIDRIAQGLELTRPNDVAGYEPRALTIRLQAKGNGAIIGALVGQSVWDWLYVNLLWVDQTLQGQGLGSRLMQAAEREAARRGCMGIWVSTYSFQAPDFYKKLGYSSFGRIDDFPRGHGRHFFQKRLDRT
ncbi:MAG: GNAT family N-acetyltransferase [Pseudomonadota bacterium]